MTDLPPEIREGDEIVYDGDRYEVTEVDDRGDVHADQKDGQNTVICTPEMAREDGPVTLIPSEVLEMGEDAVEEYLEDN